MRKTKRNIAIFCLSLVCIVGGTFSASVVRYINIPFLKIAVLWGVSLVNGLIAFGAMRLTGMPVKVDWTNKRQYLIGSGVALVLSAVIAVIPALCGFSLVGGHQDFSWFDLLYDFAHYFLIIGPVEEFVFRVYLQDAFVSFFETNKWAGVVLAAFAFGLWHLIHGSIIQVLFTFGIGLVFGFARYRIKACGYPGLALGHGLYDFMNTLVRMFVV